MATNKKITELSELSDVTLADDDVFVVVDVSENATRKIRRDILASLLGVSTLTATSPLAVDQSTGEVTISTGTVPVSSGGTGATSLTDGGVLLGSGTGAVTAMGVLSDGQMIVGDGSTDPVAESGATLRTSIGVGTGDSPQFTAIELGHASDTTLARSSAGVVTIEGATVRTGTVAVANGGTGATSLTDGGILLGSGTGAVTAMSVLTDGQMIVGDGTTDPVAESGATLRTSIGVGIGDSPQFTNVTLTGELDAVTLDISGNADIDGTLEADAMTLNGTAITATATLDTGIGNNNVPKFTSGVADDDFLRVDGTAIEGRSAAEVLSDIAAAPAAGSGNIVTTGALNSGSITSGFGSIDNGSSAITTTGTVSAGAAAIDGAVTINDSGNDVDFRVESDANANMLFVDGGNNRVGIGTSGPTEVLHIYDAGGSDAEMVLETSTNSTGARIHLKSPNAAGANYHTIGSMNASTANWRIGSTGTAGAIDFQVGSGYSQIMRVNATGLGIGTTAPYTTSNAQIAGATSTSTTANDATNPPAAGQLDIHSTDAYSTQRGGKISFSGVSGDTGSTVQDVYGSIEGRKKNATNNNLGGQLVFKTTLNSTGVIYEHFSIGDEGEAVFNEQGWTTGDFRVESDSVTNMLFVDASANTVGVGISTVTSPNTMEIWANNTGTGGVLYINQYGTGDPAIRLSTQATTFMVGIDNSDSDTFKIDYGTTGVGAQTGFSMNTSGVSTFHDKTVSRLNLKDYGEVTNAIGGTGGGTQDIDLTLGNNVVATVDTSANTFTFSNPTASDELCGFTLFLTNGGSQTVNWPGSVDWAGGTAPTLTTSGLDILVFITTDGGTIWHGMVASADSK
mgnify:CR=1 FL=1|tara:strand:+ start:30818 stop:33373 length:2556 start_codon:yes stop_codon:yes gene_type:complete